MKRLILFFVGLVLAIQISGCGGAPAGVPADGSHLPPEVKEGEDKMANDIAKAHAEQNKGKP